MSNTIGAVSSPDWVDTAIAALAAQSGADAARALTSLQRAIEGFRMASGETPAGAKATTAAVADAATNARTALSRTDLPPAVRAQVVNTLERLGNGVMNGTIEPNINNTFRQHLYDLATLPADSAQFKGALSQMTRATQVLSQVELATGTKLAYDPAVNQAGTRNAGLPVLNVPDIDADLYFRTRDGVLHIESTKYSAMTFADTLQESRGVEQKGGISQTQRQSEWARSPADGEARQTGYYMLDKSTGFMALMDDKNLAQLEKAIPNPNTRNILIGDRAYSLNELKSLNADAKAAADAHVNGLRKASANPESFKVGPAYQKFYSETMGTPEQAMRSFGRTYGAKQPTLDPLSMPSARQGGVYGALAGGAVSLIQVARDGTLTLDDAKQIGESVAMGGGIGALAAKAEQYVTPAIDRAIQQRAASQVASQATSQATSQVASRAATTGASVEAGVAARTLASRVAGSTVVGTVITTGISAYQNREGLAKGDSQAIGNVTADATVAVGSIAAATAAGAAIGSVVPVAGTAVGAVVGLAVGVGITYGAQISGARDAIANGVASAVDTIKSWF
jgi:hypothetical protein